MPRTMIKTITLKMKSILNIISENADVCDHYDDDDDEKKKKNTQKVSALR